MKATQMLELQRRWRTFGWYNSRWIAPLLLMTLVTTLAACGGGRGFGSDAASNADLGSGRASTRIVEDEDLTPGLRGTDADQNGIRDDIDRLIAKKYSASPALKRAAEQNARALRQFLEASTQPQALAAGDEMMRATDCLAKVLPLDGPANEKTFLQLGKELTALTANTKERFTAYWQANRLAGGQVFEQAREPVCD
jgi:hypothetical protein